MIKQYITILARRIHPSPSVINHLDTRNLGNGTLNMRLGFAACEWRLTGMGLHHEQAVATYSPPFRTVHWRPALIMKSPPSRMINRTLLAQSRFLKCMHGGSSQPLEP